MSAIRVGVVGYLNARPLVHGLDARPELFSLQYDVPARCAALLHERSVDLALLPVIEYLRRPDYRVVPDIAVASNGPVASVALFTTRPTTAIRSIAIDSSSRTAVALLRVLCAQWFDIEPKFVTMHPDLQAMLKRCDAALLIGDVALFTEHETVVDLDKIDLGEEWTAMTGLPFVFAVWSARRSLSAAKRSGLEETISASLERGIERIPDIAEAAAGPLGDGSTIARYLLDFTYRFDEPERVGFETFRQLARKRNLVPSSPATRDGGAPC